ncbi:MAG: hypothetical protein IPI31_03175 [Bacteroidetes bacterium]|nr:hypothetical protein [Bacteroidota bacterium]
METKPVYIDLFDIRNIYLNNWNICIVECLRLKQLFDSPRIFISDKVVKVPSAKNDSPWHLETWHYSLRRLFERMKESEDKNFPNIEVLLYDFAYDMHRNEDSFTEKQFKNRMDLGKTNF